MALRRPDAVTTPQFWAEDGAVFFLDAVRCDASAFTYQYAGYLHLYPRLSAFVGALFPHVYAPAIYLLASTVSVFLVCVRIASGRLNVPNWVRVAMLVPLALPPAPAEIIFTVTNSHWYLMLLFPLILASSVPRTWQESVADGMMLFLAAGSSPAAFTLMPLVILRLVLSRAAPVALLCMVPAALMTAAQLLTLIHSGRLDVHGPPGDLVTLTARATASSLAGLPLSEAVLHHLPSMLFLACLAGAIAVLALVAWRGGRFTAVVFAGVAFLLWSTTIAAARNHPASILAERYHFGPVVMVVWAALLLQRSWIVGFAVAMAVPVAHFGAWRIAPVPDYHWRTASACLRDPSGCVIPIPPEGWFIDMHERVGKEKLLCGDRD